MANSRIFDKDHEKLIKTLKQYVPVVDRVHGNNHPEFHEVKRIFESLEAKINSTDPKEQNLTDEFTRLREITGNYKIPNDVCESYEAVYVMLSQLDEAYALNK